MITIKTFIFNDFQENTYILFDETNECIIVDPGRNSSLEKKELDDYIDEIKLTPKVVLNTHGHIDHVLGCKYIKEKYNIPFIAHKDELDLIKATLDYGLMFGIKADQPPLPDRFIDENENFVFGNTSLKIFHIPGHSPGSIALYSADDKMILTGDVLFRGSIGRTDLPGGNFNLLISGIKSKLLTLPGDTIAFPGHGPYTTINDELRNNPFLN